MNALQKQSNPTFRAYFYSKHMRCLLQIRNVVIRATRGVIDIDCCIDDNRHRRDDVDDFDEFGSIAVGDEAGAARRGASDRR